MPKKNLPARRGAAKKTVVAKRSTKVAKKERRVRVYAPHTILLGARQDQPTITRGERGRDERHYFAERDGSILVPASEVDDFLLMGCAREPQPDPPKIVNHVGPSAREQTQQYEAER